MNILELIIIVFVSISLLVDFYLVFQIYLLSERDKYLTAEIKRRLNNIRGR